MPVENGIQAVKAFKPSVPGEYDAILMDTLVPNMDELKATHTICALSRPDAQTIPIFAMTAHTYQEAQDKSLAAGMNVHLSKPLC